jgi:hypothetical protein
MIINHAINIEAIGLQGRKVGLLMKFGLENISKEAMLT